MSYSQHIAQASDLVTPYAETRAGFLRVALEKSRYASPYVAQASAVKALASAAKTPHDLLEIKGLGRALLAAAGLSDKAKGHLTAEVQQAAIVNLIDNFLAPAGDQFVDELVFRYLLTRGDSLGGKMRNVAGQLAERQMIRALTSSLVIQAIPFWWHDLASGQWLEGEDDNPTIEMQARGISWESARGKRTLVLNLQVPLVGKNVDLCLLAGAPSALARGRNPASLHFQAAAYVALGEIKGGIDPAGADEHWKTANSALTRIRRAFDQEGYAPALFFVGAAIESAMAVEIFRQLERGMLENAANLTSQIQLYSLVNWLIER